MCKPSAVTAPLCVVSVTHPDPTELSEILVDLQIISMSSFGTHYLSEISAIVTIISQAAILRLTWEKLVINKQKCKQCLKKGISEIVWLCIEP